MRKTGNDRSGGAVMFQKSRIKIVAAIMGILLLLFAGTLCIIYFFSYIEVYQENQEMLGRYAEAYWINGNPSENAAEEDFGAEPDERYREDLDSSLETEPGDSGTDDTTDKQAGNDDMEQEAETGAINSDMEQAAETGAINGDIGQKTETEEEIHDNLFKKGGGIFGDDPEEEPGDRAYRLLSFHSVAFSGDGEVTAIDNDLSIGISDEAMIELAQYLTTRKKSKGVYGSWAYYIETVDDCTLVVLMDNVILSGNIGTLLRYTVLFGGIAIVLLFLISLYLAHRIVHPLEESYQKQKQFISDAGHELKTPIAVISTNIEILEREFGQNKWLENVRFENGRMADLVRQLLELARTEGAKPQMTRLGFSRIVTGGVLPFECVAFEKERFLETEIQEDITVMGNAEQLGNLVSILLDNALDYAPEHSTIQVTLKAERGRAVFSVSNEGPAISPEQQKYLFERFYRGDKARTATDESAGTAGAELAPKTDESGMIMPENGSGAGFDKKDGVIRNNPSAGSGSDSAAHHYGLGLAIAKAVVTAHNGKISVSNQGNRVIFSASIPMSP